MIVLARTDLERARAVAERLRAAVAEELAAKARELPRATISIGVGEYAEADTASAFLRKVDTALYRAKHEGRDRVVAIRVAADAPPAKKKKKRK